MQYKKNALEKFVIAAAASNGYVRHSVSLKMSRWIIVSRITQLVGKSTKHKNIIKMAQDLLCLLCQIQNI